MPRFPRRILALLALVSVTSVTLGATWAMCSEPTLAPESHQLPVDCEHERAPAPSPAPHHECAMTMPCTPAIVVASRTVVVLVDLAPEAPSAIDDDRAGQDVPAPEAPPPRA